MAKFDNSKGKNNGNGDGEDFTPRPLVEPIVVPQCHVCQHPERSTIDRLLAIKTPYVELERLYGIDARGFSSHAQKHLRYENEAIKQILEHEAGLAGENMDKGVKGALMRRTTLDLLVKKVFDGIASGKIDLEGKDVVKVIELREKLDSDSSAAHIEQMELQFQAFKTALEEICPPNMLGEILTRTKELLQVGDRPAIQAPEG